MSIHKVFVVEYALRTSAQRINAYNAETLGVLKIKGLLAFVRIVLISWEKVKEEELMKVNILRGKIMKMRRSNMGKNYSSVKIK